METIVALVLEAVIFLIPFIKLNTKVGEWKKETEMKIQQNEKDIQEVKEDAKENSMILQTIAKQIVEINTKLTFIIDSKTNKGSING